MISSGINIDWFPGNNQEFRLKAFERFKLLKEPNWQKPKYPKINYNDLYSR